MEKSEQRQSPGLGPGVVAQDCNPSTLEAEVGWLSIW
jgi:hypothetical protein